MSVFLSILFTNKKKYNFCVELLKLKLLLPGYRLKVASLVGSKIDVFLLIHIFCINLYIGRWEIKSQIYRDSVSMLLIDILLLKHIGLYRSTEWFFSSLFYRFTWIPHLCHFVHKSKLSIPQMLNLIIKYQNATIHH